MKRLPVFILLLLILALPAWAQSAAVNPAAYLPTDLAAYLEVRVDDAGLTALDTLTRLGLNLANAPTAASGSAVDVVLTPALDSLFPGIDVRADLLSWVGNRIGMGILTITGAPDGTASDTVFVLPVRDAAGAAAFVGKHLADAATRTLGGVTIYTTGSVGLAVGSDVVWLSSPPGIDRLLTSPMLERLSDNPHYQQVWAALPADAPISAYVSGAFLREQLAQSAAILPAGQPDYGTIAAAVLRLHPAQSAMEDGLLAAKGLDGIGFALQVSDQQIDVTATLNVEAQYPAPTLTTATAGTSLLSMIPDNSFIVFASYDVSLVAVPVAGLALLGPTISNIFDNIVAGLGPTDATPTPTPSPTPAPALTVDALIAQAQPAIQQIESLMGMSLTQLYSLTNGEYALAVFPGPGPTLGAALYLDSSDPQQLLDTIDHLSKLFLSDPTTGAQVVTIEHKTIAGVDVALLGEASASDRPALGIVHDHVLFVTLESSAPAVIAAAQANASTMPALTWRDTFGAGQEALLYLDPRTVDLYTTRQTRNPPLPLTATAGALDARADGLFVLRLALVTGSS